MLALLFPGQGSQSVGMGREACEVSPAARAVFEEADAALGFSLGKLCFEGPEDELRRTELQQPAVLTCSVAWLRALEERITPAPAFVAGHSLGEYTALVASGALAFRDAVTLVHARGRYMQEAVPEGQGGMAAVLGCAPEPVEDACRAAAARSGAVVEPANYNSPQQTVIAGANEGLAAAAEEARQRGARRVTPLPVSAPFHCSLMQPAADRLQADLAQIAFAEPKPAVVSNVDARPNQEAARIAELLRRQVTDPVRFSASVERMAAEGVTRVLEIGPGRVLGGLVGRIQPGIERASLGAAQDLDAAVAFCGAAG